MAPDPVQPPAPAPPAAVTEQFSVGEFHGTLEDDGKGGLVVRLNYGLDYAQVTVHTDGNQVASRWGHVGPA